MTRQQAKESIRRLLTDGFLWDVGAKQHIVVPGFSAEEKEKLFLEVITEINEGFKQRHEDAFLRVREYGSPDTTV